MLFHMILRLQHKIQEELSTYFVIDYVEFKAFYIDVDNKREVNVGISLTKTRRAFYGAH